MWWTKHQLAMTKTLLVDDVVITFGDFSVEETQKILEEGTHHHACLLVVHSLTLSLSLSFSAAVDITNSKKQQETRRAPKSWAEALCASTLASTTSRGGNATPWAIAAGVNGPVAALKTSKDLTKPLPFEEAIQETLSSLNVSAPAKEMKKR